jgi:(1->4)-alpha-D-glucan 1-alpha-D-glucosylmutase
VVPYYAKLGISHLYLSPIMTARSGSTHGYDIVDPTRINPELGGEDGLRKLVACLRSNHMGLILDIVPNHMGVGAENPWWQHVLEWGQASPYARWFDIDWQPADETLHGKVMAPFLGKPYGEVLNAGEIKLQFDDKRGKFFVTYYAHRFPVSPAVYPDILHTAASERLAPVIAAFEEVRNGDGESGISQQNADAGFGLLRQMMESSEGKADIEAALNNFSLDAANGIESLHRLLERQHYRLAWWRCAADGINWRRFFEVTDLVGVRIEQDDVFEATHALLFRLYIEGLADGVRIDHVDGLADPGAYCRKLRRRLQALASQRPAELPPSPAYIVVEKILEPGEQLRANWEIDGTSGYDFMDRVGALMHDAAGEAPLTALWMELTGQTADFAEEVRQARRQLIALNLAGEFEAAARALHAVARTDLRTRDFSLGAIRRVFAELLVHFPVYRTYADANGFDEIDQRIIDSTLEQARHSVERTEVPLLDVIGRWLGGDAPRDAANPRVRALHQRAITRFQQLTPPLVAKSVEDTAFYRYGRLLSRNEVGSNPGEFSLSPQGFHDANRTRFEHFPNSMLATATHDHKRGEDARMRIAALSEVADEWGRAVREWMTLNAPLRNEIAMENSLQPCMAPQPADELMLYQMLFGAWPIGLESIDVQGIKQFGERIERWLVKALREAKQVSDWVQPNEAYEAACVRFLHAILLIDPYNVFLSKLTDWARQMTPAGIAKSIVQTVLRMTSPGMPDLYQGTEFWDFSLVDPDNRRPVDYAARESTLADAAGIKDVDGWRQGQLKQQVIQNILALRARERDLFLNGEYIPLEVNGPAATHAIAFARRYQERTLLVIAAHLPYPLLAQSDAPQMQPDAWQDTTVNLMPLPDATWTDVLMGEKRQAAAEKKMWLAECLRLLPAAVLIAG